jgi:D-3-phosphoglycerate dehydrogenase
MSANFTVLFSAPYMIPIVDQFAPVLKHYGIEIILPTGIEERMNEEDILKYAGQFDGTICGDDLYTPEVIEACVPRLKVISKWGTGIDSIHKDSCAKHGVEIGNTINAFTGPVADTVLGYILAFARRQPWMDRSMKAGVWDKISSMALSECTLGVVGVGRIGKAILHRANAFGMKLLGNDIIEVDPHFIADYRVEITHLDDLLARSDFVSLNTDLNPTSYHLMNDQKIKMMKPNGILINTSRGPVVKESDLITALEEGIIAGAALDVFESEPLSKDSPLCKMDNVMLASHNANSSPAAWERVHWNTIRNLLQGLGIDHSDLDTIK